MEVSFQYSYSRCGFTFLLAYSGRGLFFVDQCTFQYRWRHCLLEVSDALEKEFGDMVAFDDLSVEYESSAFMEKLMLETQFRKLPVCYLVQG